MGLRGPKPLPTALKVARGTYRPDRAASNEPQATGRPTCPSWLNADARKEFRRVVKMLTKMGVVGQIDGNALARYASTWVRWRQAVQTIEKSGTEVAVFRDAEGRVKAMNVSPLTNVARSLAEELGRLEQAFGMTPSARSRIEVSPANVVADANAKARFFDSPLRLATEAG
jgi:P27 family predicted phage terminase small subunit